MRAEQDRGRFEQPRYLVLALLLAASLQCLHNTWALPTVIENAVMENCLTEPFTFRSEQQSESLNKFEAAQIPQSLKGSTREHRCLAKITFAARAAATLYLNGASKGSVRNWMQVRSINTHVKDGDVIAIRAQGKRALFGVIADINIGGEHYVTSKSGWKAIKGHRRISRRWNMPGYSSCRWSQAVPIRNRSRELKRNAPDFPYMYGAKYVWARRARSQNTVLLRYIIGGEACEIPHTPLANARITFATYSRAWLFLNGKRLDAVKHWAQVGTTRVHLQKGDVVAIKAQGFAAWHGVVTDLLFQNRHYMTGDEGWKAIKGALLESQNPSGWMTSSFSSCSWPPPVPRPYPSQLFPRKALLFPCTFGAKYVWAQGAAPTDTILLRFVVGTEKCMLSPSREPAAITLSAKNRAWMFVNGKYIGAVNRGSQVRRVWFQLQIGDVIAIKAQGYRGSWSGVIVDIFFRKKHLTTGQPGWKAVRGSLSESENPDEWQLPSYSSCHWSAATISSLASVTFAGRTRQFPYQSGAKYVWAKGTEAGETVLLRYTVGGKTCPSHETSLGRITYATGSRGWLFVNEEFLGMVGDRNHIRVATSRLKTGDVVAIKAQDLSGLHGVIALIQMGKAQFKTGQSGWKAIKGLLTESFNPLGWRSRSFSSCKWPEADAMGYSAAIVPNSVHAKLYRLGARYVWAHNTRKKDVILLRLVIGGEKCGPSRTPASATSSLITFAASTSGALIVNGRHRGQVRTWTDIHRVALNLRTGDVIGMIVANDCAAFFGGIVDVESDGRHVVTGMTAWKARRAFTAKEGRYELFWATKEASSCDWDVAVARLGQHGRIVGKAQGFPYWFGARYVWAKGAGPRGRVFLRYVVGGEECESSFS